MDFIFGSVSTDEQKLHYHRAHRHGIQHEFALSPRVPGAGDRVTLSVRLGRDIDVEHIACYYTTDGSDPHGGYGQAQRGSAVRFAPVETIWDGLLWSYLVRWEADLPPQPAGTVVRYRIGGWREGGAEVFADYPDASLAMAQADGGDAPIPGRVFAYRVGGVTTPTWAHEMILYHVFVDRFYPGDGRDWLQTTDLLGICGGTLDGVADRLDYIADLGMNAIWLSPIFPTPSHHGYDALDFRSVEPRMGGEAALRRVIDGAHKRGLRVLLDLACNHLSNESALFRDAATGEGSAYRDWFTFDESPAGYKTFFGVPELPQINLENPAARDWMCENGRYWLREFDIDGYRLDYANGPGPNFWSYFTAACQDVRPDCLCFGEIIQAPEAQQAYIGRLHGTLDFFSSQAMRMTFAADLMKRDELERTMAAHTTYFPSDFVLPTFIDNHDMDRFLYIAGGDTGRLREAAAFQMALPNPPIVYYGTEVGLSQTTSVREEGGGLHISRAPMPWGDAQDRDLLAYYADLIAARRSRG